LKLRKDFQFSRLPRISPGAGSLSTENEFTRFHLRNIEILS
jgi:hypothetical protein